MGAILKAFDRVDSSGLDDLADHRPIAHCTEHLYLLSSRRVFRCHLKDPSVRLFLDQQTMVGTKYLQYVDRIHRGAYHDVDHKPTLLIRMAVRQLMEQARFNPDEQYGPKPMHIRDRQTFANQLDKILTRMAKKTTPSSEATGNAP